MTCMEAQAMITPFINDRLDMAQAELLLDHVKNCVVCQEELEVYYALLTAMQQLDEDRDLSSNYSLELKNKIEQWEDRIKYGKVLKFRRRFTLLFMIVAFGMLLGVELGGKIVKEIEEKEYIPETIPTFILGYSGVPEIKDDIGRFIAQYDEVATAYTRYTTYVKKRAYEHMKLELNIIRKQIKPQNREFENSR